jgi:acetyl esterase/lipase
MKNCAREKMERARDEGIKYQITAHKKMTHGFYRQAVRPESFWKPPKWLQINRQNLSWIYVENM